MCSGQDNLSALCISSISSFVIAFNRTAIYREMIIRLSFVFFNVLIRDVLNICVT